MVEPGSGPAICGVAFFALGAELAVVALSVIVFPVTRVTPAWRFLVILAGMAGFAPGFTMTANQWKTRLAVVEPDLFPVLRYMTIVARFPKTALVSIILSMACVAVRRR